MPTLGQDVFYYSQPDPEGALQASPGKYVGASVAEPGKDCVCVFFTALGGPGGAQRRDATLVTLSPSDGDYSELLLI